MLKLFDEAHEFGAKFGAKFGGLWLVANRQVIRACEQVGLEYTTPQMKAMLSLAALNVLVNVQDVLQRRVESKKAEDVLPKTVGSGWGT